jgi:hypothetical protein
LFNNVKESGYTTTTMYPYKNLTSTSLAFKIKLNASDDNSATPTVKGINARSFPRLYNSNNNIVQHTAQPMCWPVREKVTCNIGEDVGDIKPCKDDIHSGANATSVVSVDLNTAGNYIEINPFDNKRNFTDATWCVTPRNQNFRQTISSSSTCTQNSDCDLLCCDLKAGKCDAAVPIYVKGHLVSVPSNDLLSYCGLAYNDNTPCQKSSECSTFCCNSTSKCAYLDKENPEQTVGCIQ